MKFNWENNRKEMIVTNLNISQDHRFSIIFFSLSLLCRLIVKYIYYIPQKPHASVEISGNPWNGNYVYSIKNMSGNRQGRGEGEREEREVEGRGGERKEKKGRWEEMDGCCKIG